METFGLESNVSNLVEYHSRKRLWRRTICIKKLKKHPTVNLLSFDLDLIFILFEQIYFKNWHYDRNVNKIS